MISDPIADLLSRLRNANMRGHDEFSCGHSNFKESILKVLLDEGFIKDYKIVEAKPHKNILVTLKYQANGKPLIREAKRISKPSRRVRASYNELKPVLNSQGIMVVSTSSGMKSDAQCRAAKIGGEIVCEIF